MGKERLYIKPFNKTFNIMLTSLIGLPIILSVLLKDEDLQLKKNILYGVSIFNFIFYNWYKFKLSKDEIYAKAYGKFNWWGELPLHLCNVNLILIPLGVYLDKSYITGSCVVTATLGAFLGISMPCAGLDEGYLTRGGILGFYLFHMILISSGIYLLASSIYVPSYQDILPATLFLVLIAFVAFVINLILRKLKLEENANYFYTISPEQNLALQFFYKFIKLPYLYVIPMILLISLIMVLITFIYKLI